jgi:hypothetical protein
MGGIFSDPKVERQIYNQIENKLKGSGRVIITGSGESKKGRSLTEVLVHGLKTLEADDNGDGRISISELLKYIEAQEVARLPFYITSGGSD